MIPSKISLGYSHSLTITSEPQSQLEEKKVSLPSAAGAVTKDSTTRIFL
jgi:hypothetical protein